MANQTITQDIVLLATAGARDYFNYSIVGSIVWLADQIPKAMDLISIVINGIAIFIVQAIDSAAEFEVVAAFCEESFRLAQGLPAGVAEGGRIIVQHFFIAVRYTILFTGQLLGFVLNGLKLACEQNTVAALFFTILTASAFAIVIKYKKTMRPAQPQDFQPNRTARTSEL